MICISRLIARSSDVPIASTSRPSKRISPEVGSINRSIALPVVVFPHPDSPTTPSVSPRATSNETSFTAFTAPTCLEKTPFLIGNSFFRFRIESSGTSPLTRVAAVMRRQLLLQQQVVGAADCDARARPRDDSAIYGRRQHRRAVDAREGAGPTNTDSAH